MTDTDHAEPGPPPTDAEPLALTRDQVRLVRDVCDQLLGQPSCDSHEPSVDPHDASVDSIAPDDPYNVTATVANCIHPEGYYGECPCTTGCGCCTIYPKAPCKGCGQPWHKRHTCIDPDVVAPDCNAHDEPDSQHNPTLCTPACWRVRQAQYAAAIVTAYLGPADGRTDRMTTAAMNVADRETQQLRAKVEALEAAVQSTATDALKHRGCHMKLMAQVRRAEQVEELLRIGYETSNKSEAERARAVKRAERAERLAERHAERNAADAVHAAQRAEQAETRFRVADFTARHWHQHLIDHDNIPGAHAVACTRAALDGETRPEQLGLDAAVHDAFRTAIDQHDGAEANPSAWTPPPPGDTREQLPPHILNLIRPYLRGYTSTACATAGYLAEAIADQPEHRDELIEWRQQMLARCRRNQKYTGEICPHHTTQEPRP